MYKISDVSKILGVPGYKVIELMVNEGESLKNHIKYVHGVRQIDEDGITLIKSFMGGDISREIISSEKEIEDISVEAEEGNNEEVEQKVNVESIEVVEINNEIQVEEKPELENIHIKEDSLGKYKKEVYVLDQEIRRLDYAINSYLDIISEDMKWLKDEEKSVVEKYKVLSEIVKEENRKGLLKGIFRR